MNTKKQHHHTPRFYLAAFTPEGREAGFLNVLDVKTGKWWRSRPAKTGKISRFYSITLKELDTNAIEDYLMAVESNAAPVIKQVLQACRIPEAQAWADLLWFVTLQFMRGPWVRDFIEEFSNQFGRLRLEAAVQDRRLVERVLDEPIPQKVLPAGLPASEKCAMSYEEFVEFAYSDRYTVSTNKKLLISSFFCSVRHLYPFFWQRQWTILKAPKGKRFITSDNPVTLIGTCPLPFGMGVGLAQPNTEISFPISSQIALLGTFGGQEGLLEIDNKHVAQINRRTFLHAYRNVYCAQKDFEVMMDDGRIGGWADLAK